MAKYYAKQIPGEDFDYEMYYDEGCAEFDKFWAGDNGDFADINADLIKDLENSLDSYDCDCEILEGEEESNDVPEEKYYELANYWFPKNDGSKFTEDDLGKLADCRIEFSRGNYDYYSLMCKLLEIIYGEPFKYGTIKGCCQGDWMNYICPESMDDDYIDWIESVLFATGTEYEISDSPWDSVEEMEKADDLYTNYTNFWRPEEVKEWVAKNIGCKPEEVVLVNIKDSHTYVKYNYEEI